MVNNTNCVIIFWEVSKPSRQKVYTLIIVCLLCLLFLSAAVTGCSTSVTSPEYADNLIAQREILVQISTIDALLNGVYDGVVTFETLKEYGGFGIGTFEGLDGEMVGFDGDFYQVKADGIAYPVSNSMETPFASVTFFDADSEEQLPEGMDYGHFEEFLDGILPTSNIFYAIKIEGTFSYYPHYVHGCISGIAGNIYFFAIIV